MAKKTSKGAMSLRLQVDGLDELLEKAKTAGANIDSAIQSALERSASIVRASMMAGAMRHERTGEVVDAIEAQPVVIDENGRYVVEVGVDVDAHPDALHAMYQEYGDKHSPGFPDPFSDPAFRQNQAKIKALQRRIIERAIKEALG